MARMTKKLIKEIWDSTNTCYKKALLEEYPGFFAPSIIDTLDDRGMKNLLMRHNLQFRSESINKRYLDHVLDMTTEKLELILEAHNKTKIRRAGHTVEAIATELFERATIKKEADELSKVK